MNSFCNTVFVIVMQIKLVVVVVVIQGYPRVYRGILGCTRVYWGIQRFTRV